MFKDLSVQQRTKLGIFVGISLLLSALLSGAETTFYLFFMLLVLGVFLLGE